MLIKGCFVLHSSGFDNGGLGQDAVDSRISRSWRKGRNISRRRMDNLLPSPIVYMEKEGALAKLLWLQQFLEIVRFNHNCWNNCHKTVQQLANTLKQLSYNCETTVECY